MISISISAQVASSYLGFDLITRKYFCLDNHKKIVEFEKTKNSIEAFTMITCLTIADILIFLGRI